MAITPVSAGRIDITITRPIRLATCGRSGSVSWHLDWKNQLRMPHRSACRPHADHPAYAMREVLGPTREGADEAGNAIRLAVSPCS